jgi:hypothetical protein
MDNFTAYKNNFSRESYGSFSRQMSGFAWSTWQTPFFEKSNSKSILDL